MNRACNRCNGETSQEHATHRQHCGAPLVILEPLVVQCGWCSSANHREQVDFCNSCGGELPPMPGGVPGPRPPDTPRSLPRGYANRVKYWKNTKTLIGIVFTIVFCWSILFPLIGIFVWRAGAKQSREWLHALVHGRATRGTLTRIELDRSQHINHKHPWKITYTYELHSGETQEDFVEAWDKVNAMRSPGDVVWVVYGEIENKRTSAIWPPLR